VGRRLTGKQTVSIEQIRHEWFPVGATAQPQGETAFQNAPAKPCRLSLDPAGSSGLSQAEGTRDSAPVESRRAASASVRRAGHVCRARLREAIAPSRMICRADWYAVPRPLRDRVWATWRSSSGAVSAEHQDAVGQAVAASLAVRGAAAG
jgi:hypothetical protein